MMRIIIILISCLSVLFAGCADNNIAAKKKPAAMQQRSFAFSGDENPYIDCIKLDYPCELLYTVSPSGSKPKLTYTFSGRESDVFEIVYTGGQLRVKFSKKCSRGITNPTLKVYLSAPAVEAIEMSSASSMQVSGDFVSNKSLQVEMSGAAELFFENIELEEDTRFKLLASGASSVDVKNMNGRVALIGLSGASEFNCPFMDVPTLTLECSGASDMDVNVYCDNLLMNCSGASEMNVSGKTAKAILSASGTSEINAKGLSAAMYSIDESGHSSVSGLDRGKGGKVSCGDRHTEETYTEETYPDEIYVPIP